MGTNPTEVSAKQAEVEKQISKVNVAYQRLYGFVGGFGLGFIAPFAILILKTWDEKPSEPDGIDMADPIAVIYFVISIFLFPIVGAAIGATLWPMLVLTLQKLCRKR